MHEVMKRLGRLEFSSAEKAFAGEIRTTLALPAGSDRKAQAEPDELVSAGDGRLPLHEGLRPHDGRMSQGAGSTDVGDVSWIVPTVECATATWAAGTPSHTWQAVSQGSVPAAHRAMARAASAMAGTALELLAQPSLIARARAEHGDRRAGRAYVSLLAS
jgi:aminobenzoyl-glutamate utilization protein B